VGLLAAPVQRDLARSGGELIPFCAEHGISQIVWSPLAQGVLAGKYKPGEQPPSDSRAASDSMGWAMDRYMSDDVLGAVQRLVPIAEGAGLTMVEMASRGCCASPTSPRRSSAHHRPEQVHANVAASVSSSARTSSTRSTRP